MVEVWDLLELFSMIILCQWEDKKSILIMNIGVGMGYYQPKETTSMPDHK